MYSEAAARLLDGVQDANVREILRMILGNSRQQLSHRGPVVIDYATPLDDNGNTPAAWDNENGVVQGIGGPQSTYKGTHALTIAKGSRAAFLGPAYGVSKWAKAVENSREVANPATGANDIYVKCRYIDDSDGLAPYGTPFDVLVQGGAADAIAVDNVIPYTFDENEVPVCVAMGSGSALSTTEINVVTAVQYDVATHKFQYKYRTAKVVTPGTESAWTDMVTASNITVQTDERYDTVSHKFQKKTRTIDALNPGTESAWTDVVEISTISTEIAAFSITFDWNTSDNHKLRYSTNGGSSWTDIITAVEVVPYTNVHWDSTTHKLEKKTRSAYVFSAGTESSYSDILTATAVSPITANSVDTANKQLKSATTEVYVFSAGTQGSATSWHTGEDCA